MQIGRDIGLINMVMPNENPVMKACQMKSKPNEECAPMKIMPNVLC